MAREILIEKKGRIVHITLNRPRKGNLMSTKMKEILTDTVDGLGRDGKTCAIVLRGNGKDFCHGREQKLPGGPPKNGFDLHARAMSKILAVYDRLSPNCPVPIISRRARQGARLRLRAGRRVGHRLRLGPGALRAARDGCTAPRRHSPWRRWPRSRRRR